MKKIFSTLLLLCTLVPSMVQASVSLRAEAGPNRTTGYGQTVTLSGADSFLAGNRSNEIVYNWKVVSAPNSYTGAFEQTGAGKVVFKFTPDAIGQYLIQLTITDPDGNTTVPDFVTVSALTFDALFPDLPKAHWARDYFYHLFYAGVITGYADGTLKPDQLVSRAEFLAMCFRALANRLGYTVDDIAVTSPDTYFADVSPSDWFWKYIVAATDYDVVEGYPDRTFQPHRTVNRAEALKIGFHFTDIPVQVNTATLSQISDVKITDWYARYVSTAYSIGLITRDSRWRTYPGLLITRGEAAKIIDELLITPIHTNNVVNLDVFAPKPE